MHTGDADISGDGPVLNRTGEVNVARSNFLIPYLGTACSKHDAIVLTLWCKSLWSLLDIRTLRKIVPEFARYHEDGLFR